MMLFLSLATVAVVHYASVVESGAPWPPKERIQPQEVEDTTQAWVSSLEIDKFDIDFDWSDYDKLASKRVRREVRDLTDDQWNRIVDALWVMKKVDQTTGRALYGNAYRSYDSMVCQHSLCALSRLGDQGHRNIIYVIYHQLFSVSLENALIAIDPEIEALPYWDYTPDVVAAGDPMDYSKTELFTSEKYFGSFTGNVDNDYCLDDGAFAGWTVSKAADVEECQNSDLVNPFGYIRAVVNPQNRDCVIRYGNMEDGVCGLTQYPIGYNEYWDSCIADYSDLEEYFSCMDEFVHVPAHIAVGGTKKRYESQETSDNCVDWFSAGYKKDETHSLDTYLEVLGCFECPGRDVCVMEETDVNTCMCEFSSTQVNEEHTACTIDVDGEKVDVDISDIGEQDSQWLLGDYLDIAASINDPVYAFHHCNVDRHWVLYQLYNYNNKQPYFDYDLSNYAKGAGIDDVIQSEVPFYKEILSHYYDEGEYGETITVRDIFHSLSLFDSVYTYDTVLDFVKRHIQEKEKAKKQADARWFGALEDLQSAHVEYPLVGGVLVMVLLVGCLLVYHRWSKAQFEKGGKYTKIASETSNLLEEGNINIQ